MGNQSDKTASAYRPENFVKGRLLISGTSAALDIFEQAVQTQPDLQALFDTNNLHSTSLPTAPAIMTFDSQSLQWVEAAVQPAKQATPAWTTEQRHVHYEQHRQNREFVTRRYNYSSDQAATEAAEQLRNFLRRPDNQQLASIEVFAEHITRFSSGGPGQSPSGSPDLREFARSGEGKTETDFCQQECFQQIGAGQADTWQIKGAGSTVVIFDTAPALEYLDPALVDYFLDLSGSDGEFDARPAPLPTPPTPCASIPQSQKETTPPPGGENLNDYVLEPYHGIMAAAMIKRLAPETKVVLVKTLNDHGTAGGSVLTHALDYLLYLKESQIIANNERIVHDNFVFNLSLGISRYVTEYVEACYLLEACERVCVQGGLLVCAAGNDSFAGQPKNPEEPAAYGYFNDTPNTNKQVIAVAASANRNEFAFFSNRGNFAAPAFQILLDTGAKAGHGATRYIYWSGTSFATPQVSAACALLLSAGTEAGEVKKLLWGNLVMPPLWSGVPELNIGKLMAEF